MSEVSPVYPAVYHPHPIRALVCNVWFDEEQRRVVKVGLSLVNARARSLNPSATTPAARWRRCGSTTGAASSSTRWRRRTGTGRPPEPVLRDYGNVRCQDAVLDRAGPWAVPAEWPEAEFVVGNPPFLGKGERMRAARGQAYLDGLAEAYPEVPASADFVVYWWERAVREGRAERFGFITTNSLSMTFNRRVVERHLGAAEGPLALAFAVPDHPWVDDGADVRVAVTVGVPADAMDAEAGRLVRVVAERPGGEGDVADVELVEVRGRINADLTVGADVTEAEPLEANAGLSSFGVMLAGRGFLVSPEEAAGLGLGRVDSVERHVRPTLNGRDLAQPPRDRYVIDLFGLTADEARERFPGLYDHVLRTVKPERDANRDAAFRANWWLHGRSRPALRVALAGLTRYIATPETAKHRLFVFLGAGVLPEHKLIAIALDDAYHLGVLSSRVHTTWALAAGGRLGVGNDPVYNSTGCFAPFPFPAATDPQAGEIRRLGEAIDRHRKRRSSEHPDLGLTDLYNAVEALREGRPLTPKEERARHEGLADTLLQLHRDLDRAVLAGYGWSDLDPEAEAFAPAVLARLVALNAERRAEEASGHVRYLRPAFQAPSATAVQGTLAVGGTPARRAAPADRRPWPKALAEQAKAVQRAVAEARAPVALDDVAGAFAGARRPTVAQVLETLAALGLVRAVEGERFVA